MRRSLRERRAGGGFRVWEREQTLIVGDLKNPLFRIREPVMPCLPSAIRWQGRRANLPERISASASHGWKDAPKTTRCYSGDAAFSSNHQRLPRRALVWLSEFPFGMRLIRVHAAIERSVFPGSPHFGQGGRLEDTGNTVLPT